MPHRRTYAVLAVAVLAIEVAIALFTHDRWVRPLLGDVLAVVLVHLCLRAALAWSPVRSAAAALLIACLIEGAQAIELLGTLGLAHHRVLRVVFGSQFDPRDLIAYAVGGLCALLAEALARR